MVVDAEALLACAEGPTAFGGARVFTPHTLEMCALAGCDEDALAADREGLARELARQRAVTVVLKGKETLVATPDGRLFVDTTGNRALATAGSGDALAGAIGGLLAQDMEPHHAALWGVQLHGLAGEAAALGIGEDGVLASEVVERLPGVLRELRAWTR
jgi:hydroxyethylthiazole kinase-like uncharacterized protein yjeF